MNTLFKVLFGISLLLGMSQAAVVSVELALIETMAQLEELPPVHPKVVTLMRYHGVQFFDYRDDLGEYGFYRNGKWCPAR